MGRETPLFPTENLEKRQTLKKTATKENHEVTSSAYDQARYDLENFLLTKLDRKVPDGYEHEDELNEFFQKLQETVNQKIEALVSAAQTDDQKMEAAAYLEALVLDDKADGSTMPAAFRDQAGNDFVFGANNEMYSAADFIPEVTYRTIYYQAIIKGLAHCGPKAVPAITAVLSEMRSFAVFDEHTKFKIGKDISKTDFYARVHESQKRNGEETFDMDEERFPGIMDNARTDVYLSYEHYFNLPYAQTEFGRPRLEALTSLRDVGAGRDRTVLSEIWQEVKRDPYALSELMPYVVDVYNQNPTDAGAFLMSQVREAKNLLDREVATRVLYRIELGKIGLSGNFVEYLGKRFDVSDVAHQAAFAHRVAGDGKVALFDNKGNALKYFHLTELDQPEKVTKAELLEFTLDTLFYPKPDETPEERAEREQILEEFKADYFNTYLSGNFYEQTKVMFNNLSLREQGWFLWYIQHASEKDKKRAMEFIKQYREDGFKTFLSLETGGRAMGEKVMTIGATLEQKQAEKIFSKYAQLVETVNGIVMYLENNFKKQEVAPEAINRIRENLLQKGKSLLEHFANAANQDTNTADITRELLKVNINTLRIGAIIEQLPREEVANLDLAEVPVIETHGSMPASELLKRGDILEKMKSIIRKQFPAGDDEEFEKELHANPHMRFTLSLVDGEILSFYSKKEFAPKTFYVDWFISNPDTAIKGLGEATIKLGFKAEGPEARYYAVAKPHVKSFPICLESLGFVAFEGSTDDGEYKHHYVRLSRLAGDAHFATKELNAERNVALVNRVKEIAVEAHNLQSLIFDGAALKVARVVFADTVKNDDDITKNDTSGWTMAEVERQGTEGYVLTRFIPASLEKNNRTFYAVFEKDSHAAERANLFEAFHESSDHSAKKNALNN